MYGEIMGIGKLNIPYIRGSIFLARVSHHVFLKEQQQKRETREKRSHL
jgi:hypothetical protein